MIIYIYALVDPFTHQIRYIGQSNNPLRRYDEHLADNDDTPKCEWIKSLKRRHMQPYLIYLAVCNDYNANATEKSYIQQFSKTPWGLTNSTFNGPRQTKRTNRLSEFFTIDLTEALWLAKWLTGIVIAFAIIMFVFAQ